MLFRISAVVIASLCLICTPLRADVTVARNPTTGTSATVTQVSAGVYDVTCYTTRPRCC